MTNMKSNKKLLDNFLSFLLITLGATLAALALEIFLVPNNIIDGGIIGISIMISYITKVKLSILTFVLNIPFLILGYKQLGKSFLIKAAYAMLVFSVLLEQFKPVPELTNDILLATVFGGLLLGIGVGFVIKFGACLDGTEVVANRHGIDAGVQPGQKVTCHFDAENAVLVDLPSETESGAAV